MSLVPVLLTAALLAAAPADSTPRPLVQGPLVAPVALSLPVTSADTVRPRRKSVTYSDGYATRVTIHKTLSWAMLPLFAVSYASGNQLLEKGSDAPEWAKSIHPLAAGGTAALFGANLVTGSWNLWEGRKDPNGRTRRLVHSALFLAASGGFAYAGSIAEEAEGNGDKRRLHRNVAVGSMSLSTASWLLMLVKN